MKIASVEKKQEEHICPLCNRRFFLTETWYNYKSGSSLEYIPDKVELLPECEGERFICEDCQNKLGDKLILTYYDRDEWWSRIYLFKDLETFYKDFPGCWVREKTIYGNYWGPNIYRILRAYPNHPNWNPSLRFTTTDLRVFEAIKDMPIWGD